MTFCCRLLPLLSCLLAAALMLVWGFPLEGPEAGPENSLLLLVTEQWRREALEHLAEGNRESWATLHAIVRKVVRREMSLQEALASYAEAYSQLYFVRERMVEGQPPTREEVFRHLLDGVQDDLRGNPAEAREVSARLQREWEALRGCPPGGSKGAARSGSPSEPAVSAQTRSIPG